MIHLVNMYHVVGHESWPLDIFGWGLNSFTSSSHCDSSSCISRFTYYSVVGFGEYCPTCTLILLDKTQVLNSSPLQNEWKPKPL